MVVDDDAASLTLIGRVLGQMGAEPALVGNPVQAAELVERQKFDGVFLDLLMPEMDGLELAQRIRRSKSNQRVPIVLLTGADPSVMKSSFDAGVNFFLQKPVTIDRVRHLLNATRGAMLEERRRYQRAPVRTWVRLGWAGGQASGRSLNLSSEGMLMSLNKPPAEGAEVSVEFELEEGGGAEAASFRVATPAVVTRVQESPAPGETEGQGVAVHFRHVDRKQREKITEFVDKTLAALAPDE
ncbi:MAG: response regulator [Acidobacteria bacterium]|nr:response regulator [Acidobacteriota bacterium]